MSRRTLGVLAMVAAGALGGWWLARRFGARHEGELFSPDPLERLAALGALARAPDAATLHTLRDYLQWEPRPALRRRAAAYAAALEEALHHTRGGA